VRIVVDSQSFTPTRVRANYRGPEVVLDYYEPIPLEHGNCVFFFFETVDFPDQFSAVVVGLPQIDVEVGTTTQKHFGLFF
jgi:hypothetical protein